MIISHTHKFIFAKNRKVGSSRTEIFLKDFLNPKVDIWFGETGYGDEENYKGYNVNRRIDPHTPIREILNDRNNEYTKFIVERNPWDQYLSMRDYQIAQGHTPYSPERFFNSNYEIYMIDNKPIVDHIIRYETLQDELKVFCTSFGLTFDDDKWGNMNYKRQTRKNKVIDFYNANPELHEQVKEAAWFHIEALDYTFQGDTK